MKLNSGKLKLIGLTVICVAVLCVGFQPGCGPGKTTVDRYKVVRLHGTYYEMGYQHGQVLEHEIKSIYTQFLTRSIIPFLNREYQYVAQYFTTYLREEKYLGGKFGFNFLLDSALEMEKEMPQEYLDELHGLADGSGMAYEKILVMNTFLDTLLGLLTIDWYLKQVFAPSILSIKVAGSESIDKDGYDNDGDGTVDELGEGLLAPYETTNNTQLTMIPTDAVFVYELDDLFATPGAGEGVNVDSMRLEINGKLYKKGDPGFSFAASGEGGTLTITPDEPLPADSPVVLLFTVSDSEQVLLPPPVHSNVLREERTVMWTRGGEYVSPKLIPNYDFHPTNPGEVAASINFALKGAATVGEEMIVGRNFNLLDNNVSHKHAAMFIYNPVDKDGKPLKSFVTIGWTGIVWGLAGMNADGFVVTINRNETLNNTMINNVLEPAAACGLIIGGLPGRDLSEMECPIEGGLGGLMAACQLDTGLDANCMFEKLLVEARLLVTGVPIGFVGRALLEKHHSVDSARDYLKSIQKSAGWNILVADAEDKSLAMFEVHSDILSDGENGVTMIRSSSPATEVVGSDLPGYAGAIGPSLTADDLRQSNHFVANLNEIVVELGAFGQVLFTVRPQRYWASEYFTPVNTFMGTGVLLREHYGNIDPLRTIEILRHDDLTDLRNAMHTVVFLPERKGLFVALGDLPSNSSPFDYKSSDLLGFK